MTRAIRSRRARHRRRPVQAAGAEFFFETPCVQLLQGRTSAWRAPSDENARMAAHVLLKAAKGVILATGDYVGDTEMLEYYTPDAKGLHQAVDFRNGSGLKAGMWAGAADVPRVAHQDGPRRERGRALRDAVSVPRPSRQPLHGRGLLPHGIPQRIHEEVPEGSGLRRLHGRQVLQHRSHELGRALRCSGRTFPTSPSTTPTATSIPSSGSRPTRWRIWPRP